MRMLKQMACAAILSLLACASGLADNQPAVSPVKVEYRVPYRLTDSSHIVVRIKINGEGPFNVLMDSGAPALFLNENVARMLKLSLSPTKWTQLNLLEIEGGPTLAKMDAIVQAMMQVDGMNRHRLCGVRLDGSMGYPVLARFKIDIDLTRPYMIWTRLNFNPPVVHNSNPRPIVTTINPPAVPLIPKQANPNRLFGDLRDPPPPRPGFLGVEFETTAPPLKIASVLKGSPAETAGLKAGDTILELASRPVRSPLDVARISPTITAGTSVALKVQRGQQTLTVTVNPSCGL